MTGILVKIEGSDEVVYADVTPYLWRETKNVGFLRIVTVKSEFRNLHKYPHWACEPSEMFICLG